MRNRTCAAFLVNLLIGSLPFQYLLCTTLDQKPLEHSENLIESLSKKLQEEPDQANVMFHFAQAYAEKGNTDEAIRWFKARIDKGGDKEEVWGSMFRIGEIYNGLGFWAQALHWYQKAYQESPDRAEPLYKIAQHYRGAGQIHLAYLFAKQGSEIPAPQESKLFYSPALYDHQFDEELSIAAFYTPYKEEGRSSADRLMLNKGIPKHVKEQASRNMVYYAPLLKGTAIKEIKIKLPPLREGMDETYSPLNPSIRKTPGGYRMICRTVNYTRFGKTGFKTRDPLDETMRTRNFLIDYDKQFNVLSQKEIVENFPRSWKYTSEGLEDCRLFADNQQEWFTCTTIGTHPRTIGETLCKLADDASGPTIQVAQFIPLKGPDDSRVEKNWLPFVKDNQLFVIYSFGPLIIFKIDRQTGRHETALSYEPALDLSSLRGSAAPIEYDGGYLVVVHEVVFDEHNAYYMHRFMGLDKEFKIKTLSKPFFFKHKGVEYCSGMTLDHSGKNLLLTIGVEDREAYLVTIPLSEVKSLLEPR